MLLCIDIGNTNIKLGLFKGAELGSRWRIATEPERLADEYAMLLLNLLSAQGFDLRQITGCAISSVVPVLTQVFGELAHRYLNLEAVIVGPKTETGLAVVTDYPTEVGPDLIVNAVAARALYGSPVIVIGFGTATTFAAINAAGVFVGVAIAPGIASAGQSLFRSTATLPQVALTRPPVAIGTNTITSLQSGLVFGFTGLVEGLVQRIQAELGGAQPARVIATGGLASLIQPETSVIEAVEPDLALIGLRLIYERERAQG